MENTYELIFKKLARSKFRSNFHLKPEETAYIGLKGMQAVREHARQFVAGRLSAAFPDNDGKQTPYKGHPVFIAQHATATCCRGCLEKWHQIPKGKPLDETEQDFIVGLIMAWIEREAKGKRS
ncbi:MAG: DUF4186 domain-containing protein [Candidatus Omnitrophica bacterium]|nr:DUF4186 domain-containing protein [Candidatus Omnitrophota bacterium]MDD5573721.1 DUF4186 domain-containing protein [Candidatus Omnitrophota bacterium]